MADHSKGTLGFVQNLQSQIPHFCLNFDSTEDTDFLSMKIVSYFVGPCTRQVVSDWLTGELRLLRGYAIL